ncbi:MAG: T9SS type A sorting domain-containing protein [Crocinitomicaceae bacterium]|nr:T9SS type A sorting domain-containing protein [Flavobacteriales bacterium]NQZ35873.1 T9SS type A sorting domain-containing protein [Crocinitomicaceae bacterium]
MKNLLLVFTLIISTSSFSQLNIDVMCYNVLNFPNGSNRVDTLKKVLSYYTPDILMLQELKSGGGLDQITGSLNELSDDHYVSGAWVSQQSGNTSYKLQQNIIYNTTMFGLSEERVILTPTRDVNYFKLFIKDENLPFTNDTIFLHVYVTHLKSSQGSSNALARYEMAQEMRADINALPANSYVLCGGDFNLYTSTEDAYQHLIATGLTNTLVDPIGMPGNWHSSSFPNKEILTQSTRLTSLSDGASGGLDDRFDFVLHSTELLAGNNELSYASGTYKALGNNGTCYNTDLFNCTSVNNVPDSIIWALYYCSDHLPVVFSLVSDIILSVDESEIPQFSIYPNPAQNELTIAPRKNEALEVQIINLTGKIHSQEIITGSTKIDVSQLRAGIYFVKLAGSGSTLKFVKE